MNNVKTVTIGNATLHLNDSTKLVEEFKNMNLKVNHIITDPPYNISKSNNFTTMDGNRSGLDFGEWDKDFDVTSWIKDYVEILDNNGSIIIFCSYLYLSDISNSLKQNGILVKDILVWQKSNPMPRNINRRYVQDMEFAIWGVKKGAKWTFNKAEDKPYERSLFTTPLVSGKERLGHPTQKSLKLMQQIINIHTNENDLILDPFMGSGTTAEAAARQKRNFIGVEITPEYYNLSLKRVKEFYK
ncbi:MAG: site-specific DNA-methyltransferase [Peptostreptococcaceae bacterium]